jgi:hypothetical protein
MPMIDKHPDYKALRELGVKPVDAEHVFVASRRGCDAFLTATGEFFMAIALVPSQSNFAWSCRGPPYSLRVKDGEIAAAKGVE